jgi:hypothetical protein
MTTSILEKPRFTVQVGDHLVDLPEADTRNEALRKAGLTPQHWQQTPTRQRQQGKGKAMTAKASSSTTKTTKKTFHVGRLPKLPPKRQKTVTVKAKTATLTPKRNANNANYCLFCGEPVLALRNTKHYCNATCRFADFSQKRKSKNK